MASFNNAEIRQGKQVIRTNVEVDGFVPVNGPSAGQMAWSGVLRPPNNIGLALGETYVLVLPGYSPAKIRITSEASPADGSVTYEGIGESPVSVPSRQVEKAK